MNRNMRVESAVRDGLIEKRAAELVRQGVSPWKATIEAADYVDAKRERESVEREGTVPLDKLKRDLGLFGEEGE